MGAEDIGPGLVKSTATDFVDGFLAVSPPTAQRTPGASPATQALTVRQTIEASNRELATIQQNMLMAARGSPERKVLGARAGSLEKEIKVLRAQLRTAGSC